MTAETQPLLNDEQHQRGCCHPTGVGFRYLVLIFISFICWGSYFAYDEIQPLETNLHATLDIDHAQFGILYSVYSIPNFFLVFFGGILGDKVGLRLASFVFVMLVIVGSVFVALGPTLVPLVSPKSGYIIMVLGRVIFGSGSESLNVIQTSMTSRWFKGTSSLAFAMGLVLSTARMGDFLAIALSGEIATWVGNYKYVLWLGCILCAVSLIATIVYGILDRASEKYFPERIQDPSENQLNFKAVPRFDVRFWLVCIVCMCYYGGVFPFVALLSDYLEATYNMSETEAGWVSSIVTLSSMVLSPIMGKFLDVVARRPFFVILGSLVIIPAHLAFAFTHINPFIPVVVIGLSFSLVPSALWPSIPLIIKEKELATAFGTMAAIQNFGLASINWIAGKIEDNPTFGYRGAMLFFVLMDGIGLIFAIILVIVDKAKGGALTSNTPNIPLDPVKTVDSSSSINP